MPDLFQATMPITPVEKFVMEKSERNTCMTKAGTELRFDGRYYDDLLKSSGDTSFTNTSEVSSNTVEAKRGKSSGCSLAASSVLTSPTSVKGQWTPEEDNLLQKLVKKHGIRKWSPIARKLVGRIGKQCRDRWHNHLRPGIKKEIWTEEEEISLIRAHKEVGNRWTKIAKKIPGRTENSVKNHWNGTKRRLSKKGEGIIRMTSNGKTSLLEEYIIKTTTTNNSTASKQQIITTSQTEASNLNFLNCGHYFGVCVASEFEGSGSFSNGSNADFCSELRLSYDMGGCSI